jgi:hypothetical protein
MRRPDLQELVAAWGGYDKIPPAAWEAWDRAVAEYQDFVRRGNLHRSGPTISQIEPPSPFATDYFLCVICKRPGDFGYRRRGSKQIDWYCAQHRLAEHWADVRRGAA